MHKAHTKNTVRYYIAIILALFFLFFSGDFGLIDVQKTAIVMAVGVDREEDTFIVTSQIAIPQASKQGKATETVQLVSRGKTVADAFEDINEKTGWYPKLVFCRLIVLGEKTTQNNVFDALDFFLLDEYMSDNCFVATCEGTAKDLLNVTALVDQSGSVAIQKVLSRHAERVGTVLPSSLREFAIGYYSDAKSAFLPIVKTQPQQEEISGSQGGSGGSQGGSGGSQSESGGSQSESGGSQSGSGGSQGGNQSQDKPVFSASETALFFNGVRVGTLTEEETFAFNAVEHELQLATYSVEQDNAFCTLSIKQNSPKSKMKIAADGRATLQVEVKMYAGLLDYSKALPPNMTADMGDVPKDVFAAAEKLLDAQIKKTFEKCKSCGCDLFGLGERLQKFENKRYNELKDRILQESLINVNVRFENVR